MCMYNHISIVVITFQDTLITSYWTHCSSICAAETCVFRLRLLICSSVIPACGLPFEEFFEAMNLMINWYASCTAAILIRSIFSGSTVFAASIYLSVTICKELINSSLIWKWLILWLNYYNNPYWQVNSIGFSDPNSAHILVKPVALLYYYSMD